MQYSSSPAIYTYRLSRADPTAVLTVPLAISIVRLQPDRSSLRPFKSITRGRERERKRERGRLAENGQPFRPLLEHVADTDERTVESSNLAYLTGCIWIRIMHLPYLYECFYDAV